MKKLSLSALALAALCAAAPAMAADGGADYVIYGTAGSSGAGIGFGTGINKSVAVRGEFTGYNYSARENAGGNNYEAKLKFNNPGVYLDWRPFQSSGWRLTGGVNSAGPKLTGSATPDASGNFTINGVTYAAAGESLSAELKYPKFMPYVGIGYGLTNFDKPGWKFGFDAGVSIGKPKVNLYASQGLNAMLPAGELEAERVKAKDALSKVNFWPTVKFSIGYAY